MWQPGLSEVLPAISWGERVRLSDVAPPFSISLTEGASRLFFTIKEDYAI